MKKTAPVIAAIFSTGLASRAEEETGANASRGVCASAIRQIGLMALVALASTLSAAVRAQESKVRVQGQVNSLRLEMHDASLRQVFEVLTATFGIRVHGSPALERHVSGIYQGSLQQVTARLLAGRDYVTTYSNGSAEIRISGPGAASKSQTVPELRAAPASPVAAAKSGGAASAEVIKSLTPDPVSQDAPPAGSTGKQSAPTLMPSPSPAEDKALRLFAPR